MCVVKAEMSWILHLYIDLLHIPMPKCNSAVRASNEFFFFHQVVVAHAPRLISRKHEDDYRATDAGERGILSVGIRER